MSAQRRHRAVPTSCLFNECASVLFIPAFVVTISLQGSHSTCRKEFLMEPQQRYYYDDPVGVQPQPQEPVSDIIPQVMRPVQVDPPVASHPNNTDTYHDEGFWQYVIRGKTPAVSFPYSIVCLILNIIPGLGTALSAIPKGAKNQRCYIFLVAAMQFFLCFLIIPWIWSWVWGFLLAMHADAIEKQEIRKTHIAAPVAAMGPHRVELQRHESSRGDVA